MSVTFKCYVTFMGGFHVFQVVQLLTNCASIVRKEALSPLFFQNCAIPPDKQYLFIKNFAFHSSVDAVENVTVKEILISV